MLKLILLSFFWINGAFADTHALINANLDLYKKLESVQNEEFQKLVFDISPKQISSSRTFKFVVRDQLGRDWLFKSGPAYSGDGAVAVFRVSQLLGVFSPEIHYKKLLINGVSTYGSLQRVIDNVEGFSGDWGSLNPAARDYVVKNHLLSWLLANHHIHHDQFLISKDSQSLIKIDNSVLWALLGYDSLTVEYRSPMLNHVQHAGYYEFWKEHLYAGKRFKQLLNENKLEADYIDDFELDLQESLNLAKYASLIPDKFYADFFKPMIKNDLVYASNNEASSIAWLTPAYFINAKKDSFLPKILKRKNSLYRDFEKFYLNIQELRGEKKLKPTTQKNLKKIISSVKNQYENSIKNHQDSLKAIEKIGLVEQKNIENASSLEMNRIISRLGDSIRFNKKSQLLRLISDIKNRLDLYQANNDLEKESLKNAQNNLDVLKAYVEVGKYEKNFFFGLSLHTNRFFEKDYIKNRIENRQRQ